MISDWRQPLTSRMAEAQENHKDDRSVRLSYSLALLLLLIRDKTGDMVFGVYAGAVSLNCLLKLYTVTPAPFQRTCKRQSC
jgi:hypothetical protein